MITLGQRFTDAVDYARVAHAGQVRKGSGIPYLYHLLAVSSLVLEYGGDEDQAIAEASDEQAIPVSAGLLSPFINTGKLEEVLRGAGLKDVRIGLSSAPSDGYSFDASISLERDRSAEVASGMESYMTR